jgi:hypothetical protein
LAAASGRKLDFVAVTEHNTSSHFNAIREWQPWFDRLLVIPGREITTFRGHANVFGPLEFLDFRLDPRDPDAAHRLLADIRSRGGLVSINHPGLPGGEACMGCGWDWPRSPADSFDAVEVVNGGAVAGSDRNPEGLLSGLSFWRAALASGQSPAAIGGSDNHDPLLAAGQGAAVGEPTTVVEANDLTVTDVLAGVRAGRSFIDLTAGEGRLLDYRLCHQGTDVPMGAHLRLPSPGVLHLEIQGDYAAARSIEIVDGARLLHRIATAAGLAPENPLTTPLELEAGRHSLHVLVRDGAGRLAMLGSALTVEIDP